MLPVVMRLLASGVIFIFVSGVTLKKSLLPQALLEPTTGVAVRKSRLMLFRRTTTDRVPSRK